MVAPAKAPAQTFPSLLERRQRLFLDSTARGGPDLTQSPEAIARKTAQDFVAVAFIEPILKQMRESNNAAPPFNPGVGEKQFRGIADAQVARQIAQATRFGLVDHLARHLLRQPQQAPVSLTGGPTGAILPGTGNSGSSGNSGSRTYGNQLRAR